MGRKDREGSCHLGCHHQHQPRGCRLVCCCKCAAGSGVSLHPQYSIQSFHMDNARSSPSPLLFFQSLARFKGSSRDLFTSSPLGTIKQADFRREKILCHKSPSGLSLGRYPSQGYLLYDTGKSPTIKSLVQSLGNYITILFWQVPPTYKKQQQVHGERSKAHDGSFPFYIFIS